MKTKSRHVPSPGAPPPGVRQPGRLLDAVDANLVDELADLDCLNRLVADAQRSSQFVDDGMNSTEASEERHAVAEAAAMR